MILIDRKKWQISLGLTFSDVYELGIYYESDKGLYKVLCIAFLKIKLCIWYWGENHGLRRLNESEEKAGDE